MRRLNDIKEASKYLLNGEVLTSNGEDLYYLRKEKVFCRRQGSSFILTVEDFLNLYANTVFFLYEEENGIDEEKDEAYYRYYRK